MSADNSEENTEETDMPLQIHISNVRPKPGKTYEYFLSGKYLEGFRIHCRYSLRRILWKTNWWKIILIGLLKAHLY